MMNSHDAGELGAYLGHLVSSTSESHVKQRFQTCWYIQGGWWWLLINLGAHTLTKYLWKIRNCHSALSLPAWLIMMTIPRHMSTGHVCTLDTSRYVDLYILHLDICRLVCLYILHVYNWTFQHFVSYFARRRAEKLGDSVCFVEPENAWYQLFVRSPIPSIHFSQCMQDVRRVVRRQSPKKRQDLLKETSGGEVPRMEELQSWSPWFGLSCSLQQAELNKWRDLSCLKCSIIQHWWVCKFLLTHL